ncbi:MAG: hypothetical protein CMF74_14500 [Maricaulis sp.]|nr:hypothetical protein [Maricaulis sp.]
MVDNMVILIQKLQSLKNTMEQLGLQLLLCQQLELDMDKQLHLKQQQYFLVDRRELFHLYYKI